MKRSGMLEFLAIQMETAALSQQSYNDEAEILLMMLEKFGMQPPQTIGEISVINCTDVDVQNSVVTFATGRAFGTVYEWDAE